eukprot:191613-Pyramimonas_sp.AAC.1
MSHLRPLVSQKVVAFGILQPTSATHMSNWEIGPRALAYQLRLVEVDRACHGACAAQAKGLDFLDPGPQLINLLRIWALAPGARACCPA